MPDEFKKYKFLAAHLAVFAKRCDNATFSRDFNDELLPSKQVLTEAA